MALPFQPALNAVNGAAGFDHLPGKAMMKAEPAIGAQPTRPRPLHA
ncbi:hypothetical protein [Synechococcus sp. LA31]|jgi:hypothetical protein|nr:hypothetical protein [Synechococcus sp. LA31]QVV68099.1 hypothetical protein KJJ24_02610 [Synechococcus sp. LA31]